MNQVDGVKHTVATKNSIKNPKDNNAEVGNSPISFLILVMPFALMLIGFIITCIVNIIFGNEAGLYCFFYGSVVVFIAFLFTHGYCIVKKIHLPND